MTGPIDDQFTVRDEEVRAGRELPSERVASRAATEREITFILGLVLLGLGAGLAWVPLGLIVPGAIITAIALFNRGGVTP